MCWDISLEIDFQMFLDSQDNYLIIRHCLVYYAGMETEQEVSMWECWTGPRVAKNFPYTKDLTTTLSQS